MENVLFFLIWLVLTILDLAFLGGIGFCFYRHFFWTLGAVSSIAVIISLLTTVDWSYREDFTTLIGMGFMLIIITPSYPFIDHDWR